MTQYTRLKDGTLIDTTTGKRVENTEINRAFSDQPNQLTAKRRAPSIEGVRRRYVDDLPVPPDQSRVVAIICAYSIFGLDVHDIAYVLGNSDENVQGVLDSPAYAQFVDCMLQNIREHDTDKIRKRINQAAGGAADKVAELVGSRDEKVALSAAKDILDRSASDTGVSTANGNAAGLTIRIIDDRESPMDKVKVSIDG